MDLLPEKSIELTSIYNVEKFISYLKCNSQINVNIQNYEITVKSDNTTYICPSRGKFSWVFEDDKFTIQIKEEGKPISINGMPTYFIRINVYHNDIEKLEKFVRTALTYEDKKEDQKVKIYNSTSKGYWSGPNTIYCQDLEYIFIPKEDKRKLVYTIDNFIKSKDKYIKFGRKYMLGFLLMGVMGAGKTSLVKAIAKKYNKSIYFLNFTKNMSDESLFELIRDIKDESIILIEDIDSFFEQRDTKENTNISFSGLINILDGVMSSGNGILTFITVNYGDKLDKALIRPGRIDMIIKFEYPKKTEIQELFNLLIEDASDAKFKDFYDKVKHCKITMAGYVDYLFKHDTNYMDHIDDLLDQTNLLIDIANDKTDKLYL